MVRVAIASVEAVFDWKGYLKDTFGYEIDDSWLVDGPLEEEEEEVEKERCKNGASTVNSDGETMEETLEQESVTAEAEDRADEL